MIFSVYLKRFAVIGFCCHVGSIHYEDNNAMSYLGLKLVNRLIKYGVLASLSSVTLTSFAGESTQQASLHKIAQEI